MAGNEHSAARVTRALFPELAAALDRDPEHDPVEAWISAETRRAREGGIAGLGLADAVGLGDSESRERLATAFLAAGAICERLGIRPPAPEEFAAAGTDIAALEQAMRTDASLSLVVAPHGLGRAAWERLFDAGAGAGAAARGEAGGATRGEAMPGAGAKAESGAGAEAESGAGARACTGPGDAWADADPYPGADTDTDTGVGTGGPSLALSSEAARWFEALDRVADPALPRVLTAADAPGSAGASVAALAPAAAVAVWTLRLVPAGDEPPMLGVPYARGSHPTLPELLVLQLSRHAAGLPPIDTHTFTWLAGALPAAEFATRHTYDAAERTVRISCRGRADQGPHVGIRPPVLRPPV